MWNIKKWYGKNFKCVVKWKISFIPETKKQLQIILSPKIKSSFNSSLISSSRNTKDATTQNLFRIIRDLNYLYRYSLWSTFNKPYYEKSEFAIPHENSETNPPPPLSMLFASIWDSFLAQATVFLLF